MRSKKGCGGYTLRIAVEITALALLLVGGAEAAATLTVNASGGGDYTRIQDAIDNASAGDTILVYSGTYYENVNVSKQLILCGIDNGGGKPVVNARNMGSAVILSAGDSTLDGFKAMNTSWPEEAGIRVNSNNNIVKNNTASNNNNNGIAMDYSSNNTLSGNIASNNNNGIALTYSSSNTLSGNIASNNNNGIALVYSSDNMLSSNTASNNSYNGITLGLSNNNTLISNTASNNGNTGFYLYGYGGSNDNTLISNTASNNSYGIYLEHSSNNIIYNNVFNNINNLQAYYSVNKWNITRTNDTNIIGGPYLGGNFWASPNGTGFSQICADGDGDGICDSSYTLDGSNIDYLPLAYNITHLPDSYRIALDPAVPVVGNTLTATVLKNGNPEPGILVQFILNGGIPIFSITDSQGSARFIPLEPGSLTILASTTDGVPLTGIEVSVVQSTGGGAINISSCTTISSAGTYVLNKSIMNSNLSDCIKITSNNVIFNGNGYTIDGTDAGGTYGVHVYNPTTPLKNVTVKNLRVKDWNFGIYFDNVSNGRMANNIVGSNGDGIYLYYSSKNTLHNNKVISNNNHGIDVYYSSDNILTNNILSLNKGVGIYLWSSVNNILTRNNASTNYYGIDLYYYSNSNVLAYNRAGFNDRGITVGYSSRNILTGNILDNNSNGVYMEESSSNNLLYQNNLVYSSNYNAFDAGTNRWDNGSMGNHYSNYDEPGEGCFDANNNRICDSGHSIPGGTSVDRYPLALGAPVYNLPPVADFIYSPLNPAADQTITFDASPSYDPDGNITDYWWNISGNIFTAKIVNFSFQAPGIYYVGLIVTDNKGATNSTYKWINVSEGTGGRTIIVDDSGGADYTRIQDAIDNASDGDTILVYSGTYYENVDVNKQLILRGIVNGGGTPAVDASEIGSAIKLSAGNSTFEGFTIVNSSKICCHGGILVVSNNNTIKNNNAFNNNNGLRLESSSNNTLSNNNVSNNNVGMGLDYSSNNNKLSENTANSNSQGITLSFSSNNNTLKGNNVSNNGGGIVLLYSNNNKLSSNNALNNNGVGISLSVSSYNMLSGNNASYNYYGIHLDSSDNNTLNDNNVLNNIVSGIDLFPSNDNSIYNNYFNNNNNFEMMYSSINKWNISKTPGTNINGGPYLGGNFWASPNGTGFSQTCADTDSDGICDSNYTLDANNTDYLPLASITYPGPLPVKTAYVSALTLQNSL